jgi:hypothetical protein
MSPVYVSELLQFKCQPFCLPETLYIPAMNNAYDMPMSKYFYMYSLCMINNWLDELLSCL